LVKIEKIDDECVRVTCETNRKIRNIGSSVVKLGPKLHIDDWGFVQEPSEILECKMEVERGPTILAIAKETKDDQPTILFEGREVPIKPNGCFTLISKWSEIRRHNDLVYVSFAFPTLNPVIEIQVPDGFKAAPSFGAASEEVEEISTGRKAVSGTYLPYHYMVVRWWPLSHQLKALPAPR
jgi:hypothetical protein